MTCYRARFSQGWRTIGGRRIYCRSKWEANYARLLQFLKEAKEIEDWEHEPKTFWFLSIKRGVRSYLPDFKVLNRDKTHLWVEVKGYLDPKSKTKISRFKRFYPEEKIVLISAKWFKESNRKLRPLIGGWE